MKLLVLGTAVLALLKGVRGVDDVSTLNAAELSGNPREHFEELFFDHMKKFGLAFETGKEFLRRLEIFIENVKLIRAHNTDPTQTYKLGLNQFAHLTFAEFLDAVHIKGSQPPALRRFGGLLHSVPTNTSIIPETVDHVAAGHLPPVKNQGQCGSCWAFSATGAIEGAYAIKRGGAKGGESGVLALSEQQLVSCDVGGSNAGCNGGWMDDAFDWVAKAGGLSPADAYPYTSGESGKSGVCETASLKNVAETAPKGYTDVLKGSVEALMSAVALQPVSVAIQANQIAFQLYKSGVLTGRCGQNLDHGVLLVGYGTDDGTKKDYWKIRNSWGETWGEDGYIRIERSKENLCGVLDAASYPNL